MFSFSTSARAGAPVPSAVERRVSSMHQSAQFVGLERKDRIRSAIGATQGEMFLDQASTECNGRDRHLDAQCVIRQTDRTAKFGGQSGNATQVRLLDRCRIGAHAVEQHEVVATGCTEGLNRFPYLLELAMPVDMMTGLPVAATRRTSGRSIISNDAIL